MFSGYHDNVLAVRAVRTGLCSIVRCATTSLADLVIGKVVTLRMARAAGSDPSVR